MRTVVGRWRIDFVSSPMGALTSSTWKIFGYAAGLWLTGRTATGAIAVPVYQFSHLAGGSGQPGTAAGVGADARFNAPTGVAVDRDGDVFVADWGNSAVRTIWPAGTVSAAEANSGVAAWGIAAARDATIYRGVVVTNSNAIEWTWSPSAIAGRSSLFDAGAIDGPGSSARFNGPSGLAFDPSGRYLYVADNGNGTVREVTLASPESMVTTLAGVAGQFGSVDGTGAGARFRSPRGLACDQQGMLWLTDGSTVRKVTPAGQVTTVAGKDGEGAVVDGPLASARFLDLSGIAVDRSGNVFVVETAGLIRCILPDETVVTVAGAVERGDVDGIGLAARFRSPGGLAVDSSGVLYLADRSNHVIRRGVRLDGAPPVLVPETSSIPNAGTTGIPITFSVVPAEDFTLQWQQNGRSITGATKAALTFKDLSYAQAGLYTVLLSRGGRSTTSLPVMVGARNDSKVSGSAEEVGSNIFVAANGNTFDQILMKGDGAAVRADYGQVTRVSYIDLTDDIVQVEFSGPGNLSLVLTEASGPAAPLRYNQDLGYIKGHAGIVITGADERSNVSVFSVGRKTAVNQALFRDGVVYDGAADIAFIAIVSTNGHFGGVRTANAHYFGAGGLVGLYAPNVAFDGPVYLGEVSAFDTAKPIIQVGAASEVRITGGSL